MVSSRFCTLVLVIIEVNDKKSREEFLLLPQSLYKNDPNFISPLHKEIDSIFNPRLNNFYTHGICKRWILKKENIPIGRIAAFINYEKNKNPELIIGGIGFFECINDEPAAFKLFETAKQWLQQNDAIGMDGPINFGENDKFWGLLIEGFVPPGAGMNYNPEYYRKFFENYGFKTLYEQYTNVIHVAKPFPDRFAKIADWIASKPEYSFVHFDNRHFEKFANDFMEIYNDAWSDFENFVPIRPDTIKRSFKEMKPIVDEKIIWFAYYKNEPVAFILALPDINVILKPLKGKFNLLNKIRFLWLKRTTTIHRIRFIVMGCKKKFQNKGIESGMIRKLQLEVIPRNTITEAELSWVGDFNKKMIALHEATGAVREKVHRTYRKLF